MTSDQLMSATVRCVAGAAPLSKAWKAPAPAASAVPRREECGRGAHLAQARELGPADHSGLGQEAALPGDVGFEAAPPACACPYWEAAPPMRGSPQQRGHKTQIIFSRELILLGNYKSVWGYLASVS